jgi:hypothetical protein
MHEPPSGLAQTGGTLGERLFELTVAKRMDALSTEPSPPGNSLSNVKTAILLHILWRLLMLRENA